MQPKRLVSPKHPAPEEFLLDEDSVLNIKRMYFCHCHTQIVFIVKEFMPVPKRSKQFFEPGHESSGLGLHEDVALDERLANMFVGWSWLGL